jgi:hypothetical protein
MTNAESALNKQHRSELKEQNNQQKSCCNPLTALEKDSNQPGLPDFGGFGVPKPEASLM